MNTKTGLMSWMGGFHSSKDWHCTEASSGMSRNCEMQSIARYIATHNEKHAKPFEWTKTATAILDSVRRAKEGLVVNEKN